MFNELWRFINPNNEDWVVVCIGLFFAGVLVMIFISLVFDSLTRRK